MRATKDPWREKLRFPIEQDVCYQCVDGNRFSTVGEGKTIEISSREIHFTTQHFLNPGERVRLAVAWPTMLDNACLLKLEVCGLVIRCAWGTATIQIASYEFRTRGTPAGRPFRPWVTSSGLSGS
jgi:hypothetical protein